MSMSVCLFVCLSVCLSVCLYPHKPNFAEFFVHVACGRGSVLLWRHWNTLCTSAFIILWMTSCFMPWGQQARMEHNARPMFRRSSPGGGTSWTSHNYSVWLSSSECDTRGQVCYPRLSFYLWRKNASFVLASNVQNTVIRGNWRHVRACE